MRTTGLRVFQHANQCGLTGVGAGQRKERELKSGEACRAPLRPQF